MKYTFSIVYTDDLLQNIDADDCKKVVVQQCATQMTVEEGTMEGAIGLLKDTLTLDHKTLKSLMLLSIEFTASDFET